MLLHITEKEFEQEVLKSSMPVMVDFSAVWCGPCQMMGPIMEQMAATYEGKAKVAKVDIDNSPELAEKYKVMSVPTIIFFKDGKQVEQSIGAVPKNFLEEKMNGLLK